MKHRRKRAQSLPLRSCWITSGEPKRVSFRERQGSTPDDDKTRRFGGYLMFCGMASLALPFTHKFSTLILCR
jgi:hypothetical protein